MRTGAVSPGEEQTILKDEDLDLEKATVFYAKKEGSVVDELCDGDPIVENLGEVFDGLEDEDPDLRAALISRLQGLSDAETALVVNALLLPKNVTAAGGLATQAYVNDLADTIFDRLPTRKFTPAGIEGENADVDLSTITLDETVYSESNNLTSIYTDSNGTRVWTRGFAGSKQPYSTGGASGKNGLYYPDVYNDFYSNHGGFVIGVDTSVTENIQLGVFGNYGTINLNQFDQGTGGGSWNPTGFGGGITASYVDESFYVQGLFGATGFSGDNKRQVRVAGVLDETYTASKNTTSYVGALRVGAPLTWGDTILEPQATAIWNGNNDSSYTESGRYESLALKVDSYSDNFLETTIGAKLAWPIKQSNGNLLVPNVRVAWLADWDTGNGAVKFKRKNSKADITAEIPSNQEMQNGVLLEGGVDYAIVQGPTSAWKLYAKGGAKVWANANTDWRASGGVTFSFGGAPQGSTSVEVVEELSVEPAPAVEPAPDAPAPVRGLW